MLSPRQQQILKLIIDHFATTGAEVSSFDIVKQSDLDVSSATIRNEMLALAKDGYIAKSHISSGRVPTIKGVRFYIHNLVDEDDLEFTNLVAFSQDLYRERFNVYKFLREAMKFLTTLTGEASFVFYHNISQYYKLSKLVKRQEKVAPTIKSDYLKGLARFLDFIEDPERLSSFLSRIRDYPRKNICVFCPGESNIEGLDNFVLIFSPFRLVQDDVDQPGYIGSLGYTNMNYKTVIPALQQVTEMMSSSLPGW